MEDEGPGSNEFVQVTAPEGDVHDAPPASRSSQTQAGAGPPENVDSSARGKPTEAHELKHEGDAPHEPLHQTVPKELHEVKQEHLAVDNDGGGGGSNDDEDVELKIPGSFMEHEQHHGWAELFRKLHLRS